jgi:O-antigen ligase
MLRRPAVIFLIAAFALAGSVVTVAASLDYIAYETRGIEDPFSAADLPFRLPRFGMNIDLLDLSSEQQIAELRQIAALDAHWVRQVFDWSRLQPEPDRFDWAAADRLINSLRQVDGLDLVAVLFRSPSWARTAGTDTGPPDDPASLARFAAAFASRYAAEIDFYQIWDEPNLTAAWGAQEPRPADYAALLAASSAAIRAADPGARIIAASLAPTTENNQLNIRDDLFLDALYRLGAADHFDFAAAKPFGFDFPPSDRRVDPDVLNFSRIILLREVMLRHGDGAKALWATHFGWNHLPDGWDGPPSIWGQVSAEQQIRYTLAALERAEREWSWLGGLILYTWRAAGSADNPESGFNVTPDLFRALAERPRVQAAGPGLHHPRSPYARYSGVWTFGELGADIGWIQDSYVEFTFHGAAIGLLLRRDDYTAFLYPTVDGQPANRQPIDGAGRSFLNLMSEDRLPALDPVVVAAELPDGVHTLSVYADRGWDRWALAGFIVAPPDTVAPLRAQLGIALLTVFISAIATAYSAIRLDWRPFTKLLTSIGRRLTDLGQVILSVTASLALLVGMLLTFNDSLPEFFRREPPALLIAVVTAGLVYLAPGPLIALLALIVLFIIIYQRLELGLILTAFFAPFFLFPVELYRFAFPMSELLILTTTAAWVLRGLAAWGRIQRQPDAPRFPALPTFTGLDRVMLAFVLIGCLSLIWSARPERALTEIRTLILEPALFYAIFRSLRPNQRAVLRIVDALVIAAVLVCLIGLVQYLRGEAIITAEDGARRLASVYGSPNNAALFIGRSLPIALAFVFVPVDLRRRVAAAATVVLFLITLTLTQSAGALFIGVPASIAGVILLVWGRRALLPLIGLIALSGVALLAAAQTERFARLLTLTEGTNFFRLRVWESALHMLRDHPVTGLGMDQFLYAYRGRYLLPDAWQEPDLSHPHHIILDMWVRLGIPGLIALVSAQVIFWRSAWTVYQQKHDSLGRALIIGMMGSMINLLAHGLVDNSIFVNDLIYVFVILLAGGSALASNSNRRAIDVT